MPRCRIYFLVIAVLIILESTFAAPSGQSKHSQKKPGYMKLKKTQSTADKMKMEVEMDVEGKVQNIEMQIEVNDAELSKPNSMKEKKLTLFSTIDGNTTCLQECNGDNNCVAQCVNQTENGYTYLSSEINSVLQFTGDGSDILHDLVSGIKDQLMESAKANGKGNSESNTNNEDDLLVPNTNTNTGFVHVKVVICGSIGNLFYNFVGGNYQATLDEIECFITLIFNQVAINVRTLRDWKKQYSSIDGKSYKLDLQIAFDIEMPVFQDGNFQLIPPVADNLEGDWVTSAVFFDQNSNYLGQSGLNLDFRFYMRATYGATRAFQHLAFLTDYNIVRKYYFLDSNGNVVNVQILTGVIGFVPTSGSMCDDFSALPYDLRYSMIEIVHPAVSRLLTHEIGHSMGAYHDAAGECSQFFVMYPLLYPYLDNFPYQNFGKFSECSADYISSYLSQFNSEDLATCLYTNRPTRKEFLNQFCQGLPGTKYGPDDQCKIFFGMNSSVCSSGNDKLLEGYVDYNRCRLELKDGSYFSLFRCSNEGDCENSYKVLYVFDGTRCLDEDGTMGDKYCYHGECQEKYEICNPEDYPGNEIDNAN